MWYYIFFNKERRGKDRQKDKGSVRSRERERERERERGSNRHGQRPKKTEIVIKCEYLADLNSLSLATFFIKLKIFNVIYLLIFFIKN